MYYYIEYIDECQYVNNLKNVWLTVLRLKPLEIGKLLTVLFLEVMIDVNLMQSIVHVGVVYLIPVLRVYIVLKIN